MKLRRLEVRHFRTIKELDWSIDGDFVVLVGPGDAGKSTVLDAIEFALSPRWALSINENDFHKTDTDTPISITCYVSGVPSTLLSDRRFGLELRGISGSGEIHDEPVNDDEPVLAIRLTVDSSYEPTWVVVNDRLPAEGKRMSSADRSHLGLVRLGTRPERHLTWASNSALSRLSDGDAGVPALIASTTRDMRAALRGTAAPALDPVLKAVASAGAKFGAGSSARNLSVQLSADSFGVRAPSLILHSDNIPLDRAGLGTRRLMALSLQHENVSMGGVALMDEVESGLEPHRVRHLVRTLRTSANVSEGQVFVTTHSATVVEEVSASNISVVRPADEATPMCVNGVPTALQSLVRSNSECLFARSILVCEGRTEIGLLRGLADWFASRNGGRPPSHLGIVYADGGGGETPLRSLSFSSLGYRCAVLADSDVEIDPNGLLEPAIVEVVRWAGSVATEERIFLDVPWPTVGVLIELAAESVSSEGVVAHVTATLTAGRQYPNTIEALMSEVEESEMRAAVGKAAKAKSWFKRIDLGEQVGRAIADVLDAIPESALATQLRQVERWMYDDGSRTS